MNKKLLPLSLLRAADETAIEGITRFQKLVFLAQREELDEELYPFKAGKYGPFSKTLYDDIDRLVEEGFITQSSRETSSSSENEKQVYMLQTDGEAAVENGVTGENERLSPKQFEDFVEEYNDRELWDLLEYVYEEYPRMAENSKLDI
ncbi:type II toxin-antitoxin system antitoxin SocA domain-containing protein [Halorussus caseinilyticus]|uniref:type II toxin-antitoxin system antitoxin SocA domain-containing protein n=1 Tax=Halorussus caseinilyticus TaxID=3034025 RepID=UPI0023E7FE6F|nr:type II toxin-antitoxin system antitoxin SocA domain-containing protein [Halorussus sp. DT72]